MNAASSSPRSTRAASAAVVPVASSRRTAGFALWKRASTGGSRVAAVLSRAPSFSAPCGARPLHRGLRLAR